MTISFDIGRTSAKEWVVIAVVALVFAIDFGFNFGVSNQNTYLLGSLRLVHPEVLSQDWLATQTTDYHKFFAYPAAWLLHLSESGWSFAFANIAMLFWGATIIFLLARDLTGMRRQIAPFLLVMALSLATQTLSVGGSYLYGGYLQPSTFGATGFLLACYFFVRGRYVYSGLALAAGGLFHANYLLLGFPVFLVAHVLVHRDRLAIRLAQQFAAPVLALGPLAPTILAAASARGSADAINILLRIRSPHHYVPLFFRREFLPFLGWLLLLLVAAPRQEVTTKRFSPGMALIGSLVALIGGGTLLTTAVYVPRVAQAYVWRLAPLLVLLVQIYVVRALMRVLSGDQYDGLVGLAWVRVGMVAVSAATMLAYYAHYEPSKYSLVLLFVLLIVLVASPALFKSRVRWGSVLSHLVLITALTAFAVTGLAQLTEIGERSSLLQARPPADLALYAWARTTDPKAVFLIPPQMADFRLQTRRAIVVDWKSTPYLPSEFAEWYARITAMSGGISPQSETQAAKGYAHLSAGQFRELANRFSVSFVLVEQPTVSQPPTDWVVAFQNERYQVLQVNRTGVGLPAAPPSRDLALSMIAIKSRRAIPSSDSPASVCKGCL